MIRGKANYTKSGVSSKAFASLDAYLFLRQVRFAKRTHPNKPWKWKKKRYWGRYNLNRPNYKWTFGDRQTGAYMLCFTWFAIERHPLIKKRSSPDDPTLKEYWAKRNKRNDKSKAKEMSRIKEIVAQKQGYHCSVCGESIFNGELIHLHHIIPRCEGGKDEVKNLKWLHLILPPQNSLSERYCLSLVL